MIALNELTNVTNDLLTQSLSLITVRRQCSSLSDMLSMILLDVVLRFSYSSLRHEETKSNFRKPPCQNSATPSSSNTHFLLGTPDFFKKQF